MRDQVVDFLKHYHRLTGLAMVQLLFWLGLSPRKFHRWKDRYGKANEHNAMIPRDHWIEQEERVAIIKVCSSIHVGRLPPTHLHDAGPQCCRG
jgi:hypothetical protein